MIQRLQSLFARSDRAPGARISIGNRKDRVTGSSTLEDYGQGVRIPHFSALPEPIQYEFVYESAKGTAFRDSLSGAYDGFLYGGDGQRVDGNYKFPAESVIEDRMLLESSRVLAQGKRDLLKGLVERLRLRKSELDTEAKYKSVEDQISSIEESLLQNARLLDGHERDADGVDWSGRKLGDSSWGIRLVRLYSPFITLLFVAFVDMAVLMMSLAVFIGNDIEGIIFAIPALGIQIAFPHMVGERLALVIRGKSKKVFDLVTVFVLLTSWATFAALIAVVRNQHLTSIANEEIRTMTGVSAQIASDELSIRAPITFAITLFIVLGLGVWLIFSAYKDNPYERQYLRLAARKSQLQRKQFVIRSMVEKARETVALQDEAVILLKATTEEHASAVGDLFPVAAKNIYKRALINAFASPDFTTAATRTEGKSDES